MKNQEADSENHSFWVIHVPGEIRAPFEDNEK